MYSTSDFRKGLAILYQGEPCEIVECEHHKPGKGAAIIRTRLRNLLTGVSCDPTFRSGEKVGVPDLEEKNAQFLYESENEFNFMDPTSFEQFSVDQKTIGDRKNFMVENMEVSLLFYQGKAISIKLPNHIVLTVVECDPAVRGDTVSGATKPAKLSTGYSCHVPLFVNNNDKIRIDTRTGEYLERA